MNLKATQKYWISGIAAAILLILSYKKLLFYVNFDFNFILMIITILFIIQRKNEVKSIRYGIVSIAFFILFEIINMRSLYFFGFICAIFFLYESQSGKLNILPLFLIFFASPVVIFVSELVGFEIRLYLTAIAVKILNLINNNYKAVGNIIVLDGNEFHVDPVCMGLKMVILSFYSALIIISYYQKKKNSNFRVINILAILIITYILVVLSNLFRIVILTLLSIDADTFAHEFVGIICFIIYVILPLILIISKFPQVELKIPHEVKAFQFHKISSIIIMIVIFGFLLFYNLTPEKQSEKPFLDISNIKIPTEKFIYSLEEHNVIKLSNDDLLIYIKPSTSFYSTEHNPVTCWKGCGYKIKNEQILSLDGRDVYFSELQQGKEILYTTWWYDSGDEKTISQFEWRGKSFLSRKKFHLINLISYRKSTVIEETKMLLKKNIFK